MYYRTAHAERTRWLCITLFTLIVIFAMTVASAYLVQEYTDNMGSNINRAVAGCSEIVKTFDEYNEYMKDLK